MNIIVVILVIIFIILLCLLSITLWSNIGRHGFKDSDLEQNFNLNKYVKTKYWYQYKFIPNHKSSSYYTDDELETNKRKIDEAIQNIIIIIQENEYDTIVFPKDGLGTGRAKLHIKAPKTFKYLINKIDELKSIIV